MPAPYLNKAYLVGSVVACEDRTGPTGPRLAILTIATGNVDATHRIVCDDRTAGYLLTWDNIRGASVACECAIRSSRWTGADGVEHFDTSLTMDRLLWLSRRKHANVNTPVIE